MSSHRAEVQQSAGQALIEHFRCPVDLDVFKAIGELSSHAGFFRFGPDICYGQCASATPASYAAGALRHVEPLTNSRGSSVFLPFHPTQVIENLRRERYAAHTASRPRSVTGGGPVRSFYYRMRPLFPLPVRRQLQRLFFHGWSKIPFPHWPVDCTVENLFEQLLILSMKARKESKIPFIWFWPEGAESCAIVTHDVETSTGLEFCPQLMDLDDSFGIKSSFQIVPEQRYAVQKSFLEKIRRRGFEPNIQDLNHDGLLYCDRKEFLRRVEQINDYGRQYGAQGFRAGALYRNADWYDGLEFSYDMSIPNVAHLDPQRGGCCTVFPFLIGSLVELPVTVSQDYTLFQILSDHSLQLWEEQISLIRRRHGLISVIVHPDYIIEEAPRRIYADLLQHLSELRSKAGIWISLPGEVAAWWRLRSKLTLVRAGSTWHIQGQGCERARLAYAILKNETLTYEISQVH